MSSGVGADQIYNWKKQLLDGAASIFEGGAAADGSASEEQVDALYRQVGQLKVEDDFFARKPPDSIRGRAERRGDGRARKPHSPRPEPKSKNQ